MPTLRPWHDGTVLVVENADQASVRALLTLLWDAGHDVLAFEKTEGPPEK